jgi:hypothetical protein
MIRRCVKFSTRMKPMKIQEMRSGISHLNKKTGNDKPNNLFEIRPGVEAPLELNLPMVSHCELDDARWSVVSFAQREAGGMSYSQAAKLRSELDYYGVPGLCIVTDNAAERLRFKNKVI